MVSDADIQTMKERKHGAASALKFFKDKHGVASTNNPFAFTTDADLDTLVYYRKHSPDTIVDSFEDAARTGIGNCDEKGRMCYAALTSNPIIQRTSKVSLCRAINYDHVFVVVADQVVGNATRVGDLGLTAMIVDGWTEDWYFPNLNTFSAKWHNLGNTPNPRQLYVRVQVERHKFENYGAVPDM
jgi:hypothetical protein